MIGDEFHGLKRGRRELTENQQNLNMMEKHPIYDTQMYNNSGNINATSFPVDNNKDLSIEMNNIAAAIGVSQSRRDQ